MSPVANSPDTTAFDASTDFTSSSSSHSPTDGLLTDVSSDVADENIYTRPTTASPANMTYSFCAEIYAEALRKKQEEEQAELYHTYCAILNDLRTLPERLNAITDLNQRPTAQETIDALQAGPIWLTQYTGCEGNVSVELGDLLAYCTKLPDGTIILSDQQLQTIHAMSAPILMAYIIVYLNKIVSLLETLRDKKTREFLPELHGFLSGMIFDPYTILCTLMESIPTPSYGTVHTTIPRVRYNLSK